MSSVGFNLRSIFICILHLLFLSPPASPFHFHSFKSRRAWIETLISSPVVVIANQVSASDTSTIVLPLEPASGGTLCVRLTLSQKHGDFVLFKAIVDTGSPYVVLPHTSQAPSSLLKPSSFSPTEEVYGAVKGRVRWCQAPYSFRDPRLRTESARGGIVGRLDKALTDEATGTGDEPYALLGLIKNSNANADKRFPPRRPSFFDQERMDDNTIRSFALDAPMRELRLSTKPLIHPNSPRVPLADLRVYGDFVDHYAFHIDSLTLNGISVSAKNLQENSGAVERPFVCVLDSGLTGILLIRYFWDALEDRMGLNKSKSISSASISFTEHRHSNGKNASSTRELQSNEDDRLFFARPIDLDWFDDDNRSPFVIIVGQTFLRRLCLTIDMDNRFVSFS
mmetsp:Transcript_12822/g.29254  ORF Transcript_12822/g.29254 Transcript_12822/m.29254 type:complete len:395 (-) Transcript_12822:563-1747(-)